MSQPSPARSPLVLSVSTVFPNPHDRGLGLFVRTRLQHVAATGVGVTVVAPVPALDYGNPQRRLLSSRGIPVQRHDGELDVRHPRWLYPPLGGAANAGWLAARLLPLAATLRRRFPFDLIDAHFGHPEGVAAAMLAGSLGVPFMVTLRGNETRHAEHRARRAALVWALRRAARVIAVSERLRLFAVSLGVDPARTRTIPNGVDTGRFYPRDRAAARLRHRLPDDAPTVLSAGYLIERKGHHRIIHALRSLRDQGVHAHLFIAGGPGREGHFEPQIRRAVADTGMEDRVRFLGAVDPDVLAELMTAADIFCLASSREGWPNVVHEAMACGAPVVAADVGGIPDMVPTPREGLIVPVGNQGALQEALGRALGSSWDRGAIAAWAGSRSWPQVAREVRAEIDQIVEAGVRKAEQR